MTEDPDLAIIVLDDEAMQELNRLRTGDLPEPGSPMAAQRRADGKWDVPVDQATLARLDGVRFLGESHSEAITRLVARTQRPLS